MAEPRTFASVTDTECTCSYLQNAADDPRLPIIFEALTGEYHFTYREPGCDGLSTLTIYHCPFCGGAAPKSKRSLLFAVVPREEEERLAAMLYPLQSIGEAIEQLGQPDEDDPSGSRTMQPEIQGRPPSWQHCRMLTYTRLSDVADIHIIEQPDGRISWEVTGKYKGVPQEEGEG